MTEKETYASKLSEMDDRAFVEEVAERCWLSAFAGNNPRSNYHWQADACYDEAKRRAKPWLYQRGWNKSYQSAGYHPSEHDLEAAREPQT